MTREELKQKGAVFAALPRRLYYDERGGGGDL